MNAPSSTTPTTAPASGSPQWMRVARHMLQMLAVTTAGLWALVLVVVPLIAWFIHRYATLDQSVAQFAAYAITWFPFSLAVIVAAVQLTIHVAHGMTRRSFVRAALATALVGAIAYGLVMALVLLLEGAIYDAAGLVHGAAGTEAGHVVEGLWHHGLLPVWGVHALLTGAAMVSGLVVGAGYYRFGGVRGTFMLSVGLLPVLVAQMLPDMLSPDAIPARLGLAPVWFVLLVGALVAAGAWLFAALVRRVPIGGVEA